MAFDHWYATLPQLEIRFTVPSNPRPAAAWQNYMHALERVILSLNDTDSSVSVAAKEYLAATAKEYEQELIAGAYTKGENEQFILMSDVFSNQEAVALTITLSEARHYVQKGYSLENLQQDVVIARDRYIKSYAEMEFVHDAMACISRGVRLPPAPLALTSSSKILIDFVHDAARSLGIPI